MEISDQSRVIYPPKGESMMVYIIKTSNQTRMYPLNTEGRSMIQLMILVTKTSDQTVCVRVCIY